MIYPLKIKKLKNKLKISEQFELDTDPIILIQKEEKKKNILIYEVDEKNSSDYDMIKILNYFDINKWKIRLEGKTKIVNSFKELLIEAGYKVEISE